MTKVRGYVGKRRMPPLKRFPWSVKVCGSSTAIAERTPSQNVNSSSSLALGQLEQSACFRVSLVVITAERRCDSGENATPIWPIERLQLVTYVRGKQWNV